MIKNKELRRLVDEFDKTTARDIFDFVADELKRVLALPEPPSDLQVAWQQLLRHDAGRLVDRPMQVVRLDLIDRDAFCRLMSKSDELLRVGEREGAEMTFETAMMLLRCSASPAQ